MKEVLTQRLAELETQYKKLESERETLLKMADVHHQKMTFISGAFEEIKLLIKKHYPECEPEATSKQS